MGRRYDVRGKQGYLEAQVEYALRREDLAGKFREYLKGLVDKRVQWLWTKLPRFCISVRSQIWQTHAGMAGTGRLGIRMGMSEFFCWRNFYA